MAPKSWHRPRVLGAALMGRWAWPWMSEVLLDYFRILHDGFNVFFPATAL